MTLKQETNRRVAMRDRHVSRNAPWNAKPMKKAGGGKYNWGVAGVEVGDFCIPVKQVFEDIEYRDEEELHYDDGNKINVVDREEIAWVQMWKNVK